MTVNTCIRFSRGNVTINNTGQQKKLVERQMMLNRFEVKSGALRLKVRLVLPNFLYFKF